MLFTDFFTKATGNYPYPYQTRLAEGPTLPNLLQAPTGAGKTEAVVLAWLWRRLEHPEQTVRQGSPRRLVYCLPMRTLVEQTRDRAYGWLSKLEQSEQVQLTILMGGEKQKEDWRLYPERDQIIIGTQDMLISRALNRGYAASPFRWPIDFGLLNNDCLWVLDEVQLMSNGLPTTTQLAAFRQALGTYGPTHTLWMSATVRPEWLGTVDFLAPTGKQILSLNDQDFSHEILKKRNTAVKTMRQFQCQQNPSSGQPYNLQEAAGAIAEKHQPGTLTLAVFNTVARAQGVFQALQEALKKSGGDAELVLVHSRFRPQERRQQSRAIGQDPPAAGRIVVSTQAIEAGVDIDARTLFTDLAPWPSLVQRFGRCNRKGDYHQAEVYWLDLPDLRRTGRVNPAAPYEAEDLERARERLLTLEAKSVGPDKLPKLEDNDTPPTGSVLRRRDLIGLFDTTPDLSGNYLDISRFVRGSEDTDVSVFWRVWPLTEDPSEESPQRDELCSVPVGQMRDFLRSSAHSRQRQAWRWDYLDRGWQQVRREELRPGQTLLLRAEDGGYNTEKGWDPASVLPVVLESQEESDGLQPEAYDDERTNTGLGQWVTLTKHSQDVRKEAERILDSLSLPDLALEVCQAVLTAAHWHDAGKAHPVFQETMISNLNGEELLEKNSFVWAKRGPASSGPRRGHSRPHFRHEVASALALLQRAPPELNGWARDLAAYLAMAHHGKARLSLRSLPSGNRSPDHQYLLGFPMEGKDVLPAADLGGNVTVPQTEIDLAIAQMGITENGEIPWLERTLALRDSKDLGPFRLAYLEALVRAADVRASINEQGNGGEHLDH